MQTKMRSGCQDEQIIQIVHGPAVLDGVKMMEFISQATTTILQWFGREGGIALHNVATIAWGKLSEQSFIFSHREPKRLLKIIPIPKRPAIQSVGHRFGYRTTDSILEPLTRD